ncbi:hypothetical protein Gasu2_03350 [Galdieria sulphuraria]|nr:hypothetical protein Gasu2_03350 [Galdieria sulphuraria]
MRSTVDYINFFQGLSFRLRNKQKRENPKQYTDAGVETTKETSWSQGAQHSGKWISSSEIGQHIDHSIQHDPVTPQGPMSPRKVFVARNENPVMKSPITIPGKRELWLQSKQILGPYCLWS